MAGSMRALHFRILLLAELLLTLTAVAPPAAAAADATCVPNQVAVFANRIHVRCAAAIGGVVYFALPTADAPLAARVLNILTTAQVAGRTLGINYEPSDTTGSAIGCSPSDCRLIRGVWFGQQ
jgi:hypothetical protein